MDAPSISRDDLLSLRADLERQRKQLEEALLNTQLLDKRLAIMLGLGPKPAKIYDTNGKEIQIRTAPDPARAERNRRRRGEI